MAILFWSDPHLGLDRTSHTTPASRKALRDALYRQAQATLAISGTLDSVCLGDLFDTTDNEELIIAQGAAIASRCRLVLSGNHDLPNRDGKMSSLELIGHIVTDSAIVLADSSDDYFHIPLHDANLLAVPHKRTQHLFDQTLERILAEVKPGSIPNILALHCNYASNFASDDASLNLSRETAADLLGEAFNVSGAIDQILIGHEHIPRADFGGRLQLLGNIHPTSFADISDKFVWRFTKEQGLEPIKVWDSVQSMSLDWEFFLADSQGSFIDVQFIEINGTAPAGKLPEIARAIQKLWSRAPDALMIRNNVKSETLETKAKDIDKALDIPTRISREVQNTPYADLWAAYLARI